jgi:putative oxidoreductase
VDIVFLIGRILAGGYFITGGIHHFTGLGMMAGYAKSKGVPAPSLAVGGSGVLLLLGGLSILLGYQPLIGAGLLALFLIVITPAMHPFWSVRDAQAKMGEQINFMKNVALLGLVLMLTAIPQPWAISLGR